VITSRNNQFWLFAAFFFAFAVKIPIFPFHTWQPDTYTESPAAGSMILSGVMLKMGIYGIIRFLLPLCRTAFPFLQTGIIILVVAGIIYASVIALRQNDLKRFIAWVSIAHVGLISAGAFSMDRIAMQGAVLQMISHGINVVGLFIVTDMIQSRYKTRDMDSLGGIARINPWLGILSMIILLGTVALPLTNGFAGEFMLLAGLFRYNPWIAAIAGMTIIFGAVYMLRMYQKVMYGSAEPQILPVEKGLAAHEWATLVPLSALVILIGCWPGPVIRLAEPALNTIFNLIHAIPN
jgi:NADH-quinone oxidoreductase subunit M